MAAGQERRRTMTGPQDLLARAPLPEAVFAFTAGDDGDWTVVHVEVREGLSELYECSVVLAAAHGGASPDDMVGTPAMVEIHRGLLTRRVHGIVRRVEDLGTTAVSRYVRAVVVPSLWTLSQRVDSRVFQDMTIVAIVREVFRVAGVYPGERLAVDGSLEGLLPRNYCTQYRETDLAFVLRLLEEEGIPYYFTQEGDAGETLVLCDEHHAWTPCPTMDHATSVRIGDAGTSTATAETVQWFDWSREMRPTSMTLREYDFTRPSATIDMTPAFPRDGGPRAIYDAPARFHLAEYDEGGHVWGTHDGVRQSHVRHEAGQVPGAVASGAANVSGLSAGGLFTLAGHERADLDVPYVVTRVVHVGRAWSDLPGDVRASERLARRLRALGIDPMGTGGGNDAIGAGAAARYENRFEAIPASVTFRPPGVTPRPIVHGPQTAVVVGPAGEEIYVDFHGRIKVQFHWDRLGQKNAQSSCWVRVAQAWAGSGWGFVFIPRIGMEVLVTFLEGDPDQPLVTGAVYNGQNNTPYGLPADKTKSTIKTNSSPTTGGYNELRFEDAAGQEQIYVQAEKDHDTLVKHNQTVTVERNRTKTIKGRERNTVVKDRITQVQGNEQKEVVGNQDVEVHGPSGATMRVDQTYYIEANERVVVVCGASTIVMAPDAISVTSPTIRLTASDAVHIKGGVVKINCD